MSYLTYTERLKIEQLYPKGTDFSKVKQSDLDILSNWINDFPRKILYYQSAKQVFEQCTSKIFLD